MNENVKLSYLIKDSLLKGKLTDFGRLLNDAWVLKKSFSKKITNAKLNNIYEVAMKNGAIGGSYLALDQGAFYFFTNYKSKFKLINALNSEGLPISNFSFNNDGLTSWQTNY